MKARYRRKCPEDCRYKDRRTSFCGFCMLDILERGKERNSMQMMIDNPEKDNLAQEENPSIALSDPKDLKQLVDTIPDGVVLSVNMEEVVIDYGKNTK